MGFADLVTDMCPSYHSGGVPQYGWVPVLLLAVCGCFGVFSFPSPPDKTHSVIQIPPSISFGKNTLILNLLPPGPKCNDGKGGNWV